MRAARLDNSARLQRVHALLLTGGEFSTLEIVTGANVCAVNSAVAELRENGVPVSCRRDKDRWLYRLAS